MKYLEMHLFIQVVILDSACKRPAFLFEYKIMA